MGAKNVYWSQGRLEVNRRQINLRVTEEVC